MRPGNLRCRIVIEQPTETRDTDGAIINTWSTFATVWAEFVMDATMSITAKMMKQMGQEKIEGKQPIAEASEVIRIRYLSGLTSKMRVKYMDQYYNIRVIGNPNMSNKELLLFVTAKVT